MKPLISFGHEFYEKRKFQQDDGDKFLLAFAKVIFAFLALFLIWTAYFHYQEIDYIKNGASDPNVVITVTEPIYYVIKYVISIVGMALMLLWIKRLKRHS